MSVKVNMEIVSGERTARCNIEVPLDAIDTILPPTDESYEGTPERIREFMSATMASLLQVTSDNKAVGTETNSKRRKRQQQATISAKAHL